MSFDVIFSCVLCAIGLTMSVAMLFSKSLQACFSSPGTENTKGENILLASFGLAYIILLIGIFTPGVGALEYSAGILWFVWMIAVVIAAITGRKKAGLNMNYDVVPVSKQSLAKLSNTVVMVVYICVFPASMIASLDLGAEVDSKSIIELYFIIMFLIILIAYAFLRQRSVIKYIERQEKYFGVSFDAAMKGRNLHAHHSAATTVCSSDWFVCARNFQFFAVHRRYISSYKLNKRYMIDQQRIVVHDVEGGRMSVMMKYYKSWGPGIADKFERWMEFGGSIGKE